jgi:hypothetical protein
VARKPRHLLGEDTLRAPRNRAAEAAYTKAEDDGAASDGQVGNPADVAAVRAARTPMAAWASAGSSSPAKINLHRVFNDDDLLDTQTGEMRHGDRDAQRAPPTGSHSPERASHQYYVSWHACTENEPDPVPD